MSNLSYQNIDRGESNDLIQKKIFPFFRLSKGGKISPTRASLSYHAAGAIDKSILLLVGYLLPISAYRRH